MGKVLLQKDLSAVLSNLKGKKIVFTNGVFDILHIGHLRYLQEARSLGDVLIVGLNSDRSVKKIKGKARPIIPEKERAEILSSLEPVDYVIIFNETTPNKLIQKIKPHIHVKGGDYLDKPLAEEETVKRLGGKIVFVKKTKGKSTSNIIKKILKVYANDEF